MLIGVAQDENHEGQRRSDREGGGEGGGVLEIIHDKNSNKNQTALKQKNGRPCRNNIIFVTVTSN